MSSNNTAKQTSASILSALSQYDLSEADKLKVNEIISAAFVNVVEEMSNDHVRTAVRCCGPEADVAHQIRHELNLKKKALIANLMGPH